MGAIWGQELASVLKQCQGIAKNLGSSRPSQSHIPFMSKVKSSLCDVWIESSADIFDSGYTPLTNDISTC